MAIRSHLDRGIVSLALRQPWRIPVRDGRAAELVGGKGVHADALAKLGRLVGKRYTEITIIDQAGYSRFEAQMNGGPLIIISGYDAEIARAILASHVILDLPVLVRESAKVEVGEIYAKLGAKTSGYYYFEDQIEVHFELVDGNARELISARDQLLHLLDSNHDWPQPNPFRLSATELPQMLWP